MARSFRILRTLGRGSYGVVHLAEVRDEDTDFVQTLALKCLHERYDHDTEVLGRLRDEARLLGLLQHEHIVRVHGLSRVEGRLAILMEPVEGVDLSRLDHAMPHRAALQVAAAIADALDAAWRARPPGTTGPLRVVHRDIKPSNIMVTARGAVKVMDFGVARATFETREIQTRSQQYGTARYMAPERWLQAVAEAPSDVFSLGITLLELVHGAPVERMRLAPEAFADDLNSRLEQLQGTELATFIARLCAYAPEERPSAADARETATDLADKVGGDSLRSWAASWVASQPEPTDATALTGTVLAEEQTVDPATFAMPPTVEVAERTAPTVPKPTGRARWLLLPVLGLAAGALWISSQPEPTPPPAPTLPPPLEEIQPDLGNQVADPPAEPPPQPPPPVPRPTAEPVAPRVSTTPQPQVAQATEEIEAPAPRVPVSFTIEGDLHVRTDEGEITARPTQAQLLPAEKTVRVYVTENGRERTCTIYVGDAPSTVRISAGVEGCTQR